MGNKKNMEMLYVWLQFAGLAAVIGFSGYKLSFHGDQIAEKTGLGQNFVGLILFATITSMPELMTGISSVTITDNPNIAIGDILGSCVFNLVLVFILDFIYREGSVYSKATQGHILSGALGIVLLAFLGFAMTVTPKLKIPQIGHIGWYSLFIPILYLMAIRFSYNHEKSSSQESNSIDDGRKLKSNVMVFSLAAIFIILAGSALPYVGEKIMQVMGWQSAFVGTVFIAFATSLPEIAVTLSAIKLKAVEIAFSNLLGSNLFNIVVLAIDDFAYTKGPLLAAGDPGHLVTVQSALIMTGVVILALISPPKKRFLRSVSYLSLIILCLYIINVYVIYKS